MIAECLQRCGRHGIDGVGTDQLLDIEHVAIVFVLGAGRGPQQPLRLGTFGGQLLPTRPRKQTLVLLVGELGVGNRDLAFQGSQAFLLGRVVGFRNSVVELLVGHRIDAADEEACNACDVRRIAALGEVFFQARKIGFSNLQIDILREQQRDVDVDAFANQMLDCRQALRRCRHLDHEILALDVLPEPLSFGDRTLGVHRQIRRHLQADEAILALEIVVDRPQYVGRVLDVFNGELLEQLGDRAIAAFQGLSDRAVIFIGTADRLFEDRRI